MEAIQTADTPAAPEEIWAILREVGRKHEEIARRQEETDRQMKETDRILKENVLEYDRRIGHLDNLFGEIAEHMIAPKLRENFRELGLDFPRANSNIIIDDYENDIFFETDVMLENGDKAILVEVKAKITIGRINKHIERLEKMRKYADLHGDKRTFLGAVAGIVLTNDVKRHALEQGLYFIEPTGDNFHITSPEGKPKEW